MRGDEHASEGHGAGGFGPLMSGFVVAVLAIFFGLVGFAILCWAVFFFSIYTNGY